MALIQNRFIKFNSKNFRNYFPMFIFLKGCERPVSSLFHCPPHIFSVIYTIYKRRDETQWSGDCLLSPP